MTCGEEAQSEIKQQYFDCSVTVRCSACDSVLCDSKPRKANIGNLSEANSVMVFHSISNGYGRAGLSRLSALFGTKEMTQSVFMIYAKQEYLHGSQQRKEELE